MDRLAHEFSLIAALGCLGRSIIEKLADGPDRGYATDLRETFAITNQRELSTCIAVTMHVVVVVVTALPGDLDRGEDHLGEGCDAQRRVCDHLAKRAGGCQMVCVRGGAPY